MAHVRSSSGCWLALAGLLGMAALAGCSDAHRATGSSPTSSVTITAGAATGSGGDASTRSVLTTQSGPEVVTSSIATPGAPTTVAVAPGGPAGASPTVTGSAASPPLQPAAGSSTAAAASAPTTTSVPAGGGAAAAATAATTAAPAGGGGQPATTVAANAPDATLLDLPCTGPLGPGAAGGFDLQTVTVLRRSGTYVFSARYAGAAAGHDVHITIDITATTYRVDSELFETGDGVGQLVDLVTGDDTFLDPPQTIASGRVDLTIAAGLMPGLGATIAATIVMKVDGALVETCA